MKTAQLAGLLLIVCIGSAMALECYRCTAPHSQECYRNVETCQGADEVCVLVLIKYPKFSYYKQCMRQADAFIVSTWSHHQVFTCNTDRCN